jgi:hypothetical protein
LVQPIHFDAFISILVHAVPPSKLNQSMTMKLLLINPNTSSPMTHAIAQGAKAVAAPTTEIVAVQPSFGPLSIEGHYDEAFAAAGVAEQLRLAQESGPILLQMPW